MPGPHGDAEPQWLDESESRAWRSWLTMNNRLRERIARDLYDDSGLSWADYEVLVHLSEEDGHRVRMSELAERLDWSKSRLSHQVARMEARGLVSREECPSDARGAFAALQEDGLAEIRRAAPAHVASVRRHFIDVLGDDELERLSDLADAVLDHLRQQTGPSR